MNPGEMNEPQRRIVEDPFEDSPSRRVGGNEGPEAGEAAAGAAGVVVPMEALSAEALKGLIEEFVTRHGTDLAEARDKVEQVRSLLRNGKARIVFDPNSETCNIVASAEC